MNAAELSQLIRETASGRSEVDTWDLTDEVLALLSTRDRKDVLRVTLHVYVGDVLRNDKLRVPPPIAVQPEPTFETSPAAPVRRPGPSRRSAGFAAWRAQLDMLVAVSANRRIRLGDCSLEEVRQQAAKLAQQAQDMAARSAWWAQLADAMEAAKVSKVADLPENVVRPILKDAA